MIANLIPGPRDFDVYIYKIRYFIAAIALLMVFSFVIGAAFAATMPEETKKIVSLVSEEMKTIDTDSSFDLMINLFVHNAFICLLMVILGLALGILSLLIVFDNGLMLGLVGGSAVGKAGLLFTLAAIVPHGIIELPMMGLSAAIGLRLGYCVLMSLFKKQANVPQEIKEGIMVFVVWIVPLLLVAAFVESYITTALVLYMAP